MRLEPTHLLGTWSFHRTIDDRLALECTAIDGETGFTRADDGRIRWGEQGVWARPSGPVAVSRTLWIEPRSSGWFVTFEDGRDFHPWTTGESVEHPCGRDVYRGVVTVCSDDQWELEWTVWGPEKDYTMHTSYTRA